MFSLGYYRLKYESRCLIVQRSRGSNFSDGCLSVERSPIAKSHVYSISDSLCCIGCYGGKGKQMTLSCHHECVF